MAVDRDDERLESFSWIVTA